METPERLSFLLPSELETCPLSSWFIIFLRHKVGLLFKICELLTSHGVDICNQLSMPMVMFDALKDWCQF